MKQTLSFKSSHLYFSAVTGNIAYQVVDGQVEGYAFFYAEILDYGKIHYIKKRQTDPARVVERLKNNTISYRDLYVE
jgi:hypothetical protein